MSRHSRRDDELRGVGPFQFKAPKLSPGEAVLYDLREREKRRYVDFLPFDLLQVRNKATGADVNAEINGVFSLYVSADTVESFDQTGVTSVRVENLSGSTTISAEDVVVQVANDAYGADERARERARKPWLQRAADDLVPGGLPGGGGR